MSTVKDAVDGAESTTVAEQAMLADISLARALGAGRTVLNPGASSGSEETSARPLPTSRSSSGAGECRTTATTRMST